MLVVYKAENIITGEMYVGRDSNWPKRKHAHIHQSKRGTGWRFHNALRKYGIDSFDWVVLEEVTKETISEKEKLWIQKLQPEYNLTPGGEGRQAPQTETTKLKIATSLRGNRNAFGNQNALGNKHTPEAIEKIRKASKLARQSKKWSTKKKIGTKIIAGGITNWTKEERSANAKKVGSMFWWNNGSKNIRSIEKPSNGWIRGRFKKCK